jgi:hypothetical protein
MAQRFVQASRLQWDEVSNRVGGHRPPLQSDGFYQTNPLWKSRRRSQRWIGSSQAMRSQQLATVLQNEPILEEVK